MHLYAWDVYFRKLPILTERSLKTAASGWVKSRSVTPTLSSGVRRHEVGRPMGCLYVDTVDADKELSFRVKPENMLDVEHPDRHLGQAGICSVYWRMECLGFRWVTW